MQNTLIQQPNFWPNLGKSTISSRRKQLEFLCLTWYCHEHKMLFEYFWDLPYNFIYLECIQPIIALNFKFSGCFWELNILCVKCAKMVDCLRFGHIYICLHKALCWNSSARSTACMCKSPFKCVNTTVSTYFHG